ncbi:ABC transporter substrate-binding protein [Streptomyces sp. NBC_01304]|uniref:ABC transporter substrate-binding protein n=1 Tax=Streptomyces sp. NBC_01304 TaxID=2903818 RepID=UPI002E0E7239|nr:ABC transporter substrate-binding protein [Streptomyces sp. NBC_01304]
MNRKTLVLPAVIGLLAPVLAACGGSGSGDGSDGAIVVGTTDGFTASKAAPAPFDPAYAYDAGSWNILRQTVQTLMRAPRGGAGEPVPEAAESCKFTDTGNQRYDCELRDDLAFSNGDKVTPADVKFSIERVLKIHKLLAPKKLSSGVAGLIANVENVEVMGKHVIFHLKTSDATFPHKLATPAAGIVNPDMYDKTKLRDGFQVDGSGPYSLEAEVKDNKLVKAVFTKNPHYKGHLTGKTETVELRPFGTADQMGKALKSGDIDMMARTLETQQIKQLTADADDSIDLVEMPGLGIRYLGFETDAPVVKNKAVRQAMAQLVDRGAIISQVYGAAAEPLYSLVPSTIAGHTNSFRNEYGEPSVTKAKGILTKASITTPVKLTLNYTTDHYGEGTKREFELLQKQLNDSGLFDVKIKGTPWGDFRPTELKGEYAVYGMGWFPDFPDADNFIAPFLDEGNFLNSPYTNSEIRDELIPQSRREADRIAASDSLERIQDIVAKDVPVLPLWQGKEYVAARDDITGVEWAFNASSNLQLWELARGMKG